MDGGGDTGVVVASFTGGEEQEEVQEEEEQVLRVQGVQGVQGVHGAPTPTTYWRRRYYTRTLVLL